MGDLVPHHVIATDVAKMPAVLQKHKDVLKGRSMLCRRTRPIPIECVARGYLSGSGWKEYRQSGTGCGVSAASGACGDDRLSGSLLPPRPQGAGGRGPNIRAGD